MSGLDYDERYRKVYEEEASTYDHKRFSARRGRFGRDYQNRVILDLLDRRGLLADTTIVDIAAGTGRITHELAKHPVEKIVAVDISESMLTLNRQALPEPYRIRVEFRVMSMKEMDLPSEYADAVTIGSFFHLIPRDEYGAYVKDVYRVLKPGGILLAEVSNALMLGNPTNFLRVFVHRHVRKKHVTSHVYPWEIAKLFEGFRVEEVVGTSYPVMARKYATYARYSAWLGRTLGVKYVAGKYTVVLRKP